MAEQSRKTTSDTDRADNNREREVTAIRRLRQMLAIAADPKFRGTVAVEISAKDGYYNPPKYTLVEYDHETGGLKN